MGKSEKVEKPKVKTKRGPFQARKGDVKVLKDKLAQIEGWPFLRVSDWSSLVQEVFGLAEPPKRLDKYYNLARDTCNNEKKRLKKAAN